MAHITEFTVEGLAGRTEPYSQQLDRHLNVFFGLNGSGKTSLLKIFHAAMNDDVKTLDNVPFRRAEVKIYSIDRQNIFTYSYTKPQQSEVARGDAPNIDIDTAPMTISSFGVVSTTEAAWMVQPDPREDKKKKFNWSHRYLPTSRLYMSDRLRQLALETGSQAITEEILEAAFGELVKRLWSSYSAEVLGAVQRAQAKGLADILKGILTGRYTSTQEIEQLDPPAVYARVSRFMERQGAQSVLGDAETFQRNYRSNAELRSVVADINSVELEIQKSMAPREKLQSLIEGMFTGSKKVYFSDTAIEIKGTHGETIGLPRLSSGEKQLLRIFIDTLTAGPNSLIIDEPEISMHVDWQRQLVATMRKLNPETQIIAATHSPEIMAEVDDKNIFSL